MTSTLPPLVQAFSGAIGSVSANALTYPIDLVTTRLQLDPPHKSSKHGGIKGAGEIFAHIFKEYGLEAFYDGLWADSCATLLSNFFYFLFYSSLRSLSTKRLLPFSNNRPNPKSSSSSHHKPSLLEELILGFIAGIASRVVSTPLNIVTLKLQTEREDVDYDDERKGMVDVIRSIYKTHGLAGFWRGFQASAMLSLNPSITLACFQMFRKILTLARSTRFSSAQTIQTAARALKHAPANANLHPWEAFFGGAISNSIATFILYPLILGKKRVQVSSSATISDVLVDAYRGVDVLAPPPPSQTKTKTQTQTKAEHGEDEAAVGGIQGLYQGLQMKIITVFLSQGVTFLVKGRIEQLVIAAYLARLGRASASR